MKEDRIMGIKKILCILSVGALIAISGVAARPAPAEAALNCTAWYQSGWAYGNCASTHPGGAGKNYRVVALCVKWFTYESWFKYGNTVAVGGAYSSGIDGCGFGASFSGEPRTQTVW